MNTNYTSAAAAARLARNIKVGDHVLYGKACLKVRVPVPADVQGTRDGYCRTTVRSFGRVVAVTPTGLLRVQPLQPVRPEGSVVSLTATETKNAEVLTEAQITRRNAVLFGWE